MCLMLLKKLLLRSAARGLCHHRGGRIAASSGTDTRLRLIQPHNHSNKGTIQMKLTNAKISKSANIDLHSRATLLGSRATDILH